MKIRVKCGALYGWYCLHTGEVEAEILNGFTKIISVSELYKLAGDGRYSNCFDGIMVSSNHSA